MYHSTKKNRSFYTDEKIANLHKNIASLPWAKEKADKIIADADFYLDYGIDKLAQNVPSHELKRSFDVNQEHGCPFCGMEMMRHGPHGWKTDFVEAPWKVKCPSCGASFPSNDFGSFYQSGLDEHGMFSYSRADRSLLVNTLYPEKGSAFAIDDGNGWLADASDPEHFNYTFIAYYCHSVMWDKLNRSDTLSNCLSQAIATFNDAYLITENKAYGRAGVLLLNKFASVYSHLDSLDCKWTDGFKLSHGHAKLGRMAGSIADTIIMEKIVSYYDGLFPCIDDELAAFLRENPVRYAACAPHSGEDIIENIEKNMLLQIYPDIRSYVLNCNPGPPQTLLLKTARVLERDDLFDEYAEFIFRYIDHVRTNQHRYDMESLLLSEIDRDGFAGEVSPTYNSLWSTGFMSVAELLVGHRYDLFKNVKFKKLYSMDTNYIVCDKYTLPIADSLKTGEPTIYCAADAQLHYFEAVKSIESAKLLDKIGDKDSICKDWFMDCAKVDREIHDIVLKHGKFTTKSRCLPGYGLAVIESKPENRDPESCGMFFGRNMGHGHRDTLNISIHGFGVDLAPDHGYANFADMNAERFRWTSNMISHNTVTIRREKPFSDEELAEGGSFPSNILPILGGQIRHYDANGKIGVIDTEVSGLYAQASDYRRTLVSIDLDGKSRYIVDIFAAQGEGEHYYSFHAAGTETAASGIEFTPRSGSYAGVDVPFADPDYSRLRCDGFNYLNDVRQCDNPIAPFSVDWKICDNWHVWNTARNVHLKMHMLSQNTSAALASGQPPQTKVGNARAFTYFIARSTEKRSTFVSVFEPYENDSFILTAKSVDLQDKNILLTQVTLKSGRCDFIVFNRTDKPLKFRSGKYNFDAYGLLNVISFDESAHEAYRYTHANRVICGTVCDFTRDLRDVNTVTANLSQTIEPSELVGRFMDIKTDALPNAFYEIKSAKLLSDGLWELGTGDSTFINGYSDRCHREKGFAYFIEHGAPLTIAMSDEIIKYTDLP